MGLDHVKSVFEHYGRVDPMYAVLTDHSKRGGRWSPEEFFAHGRDEISRVMAYARQQEFAVHTGRALDFGCGVGRLTQALSAHFPRVTGVDISSTMIEAAERHNTSAGVEYVVNDAPHLAQFGDSSFDFVYSNITLQHVPPAPALAYLAEFLRVLKPGGLAIFQLRIGPRIDPGTLSAWWYRLRREQWRRVWQRMRGRIPYEMHFVSRCQVDEVIAQSQGKLLDVVDMSDDKSGKSLRFAVSRP